ncbi:MAG: S1 RNA-binding domain-containing protein [Granulosicoccus sp.]
MIAPRGARLRLDPTRRNGKTVDCDARHEELNSMRIGYAGKARVLTKTPETLTLDGGELGPLQLPRGEAEEAQPGDMLDVYLYTDTNGSPVPTTTMPLVQREQCASLQVVDTTSAGAFLDWGLEKNLLLPFAEQRRPVQQGRHESVLVYLDNTGRLAASSRLDHHLPDTTTGYRPWQPVSLLIYQRTDLGLKAVVDHRCIGLIYKDEIFQSVRVGDTRTGFVKRLRQDGRLDLALQPPGQQLQPQLTAHILEYLRNSGGECRLSDNSSPEEIKATFQVSKKNFKKALSTLYKQRQIIIEEDRIRLVGPSTDTGKS